MHATRYARSALSLLVAGTLAAGTFACGVSDEAGLPKDVEDPGLVLTPSGVIGRYRGTVDGVARVVDDAVFWTSGLPTDEIATTPAPIGASSSYTAADSRQDWSTLVREVSATEDAYLQLNTLRNQAHEARGLLAIYLPDTLPALRGHLYALEGYMQLFLADAFCSGIPLSTVDVGGDYTLAAGSTTEEVYTHAKALFDTAFALTGDSLRFQQLAALGQGRALLALGDYAGAAAAIAAIPDGYQYQVTLLSISNSSPSALQELIHNQTQQTSGQSLPNLLTMGDRQGTNGLDFVSSNDPRTPAQDIGRDDFGNTIYYPNLARFPATGSVIHTLADGVEARLIEAEAALRANSSDGVWLAKLNALRTNGAQDGGGVYQPGSGGYAGLAPLEDPGASLTGSEADSARVDLLFRERAFWLYLTAHRLGDLRRLVRQYLRNPETVFPTGTFAGGNGLYGRAVVIPVPVSERITNTNYTGCIDPNA